MNLHSIEAKVSPDNRGAIFLMEKIGFKKEAHFVERIYFDEKFSDLAVYSLITGNEHYAWKNKFYRADGTKWHTVPLVGIP